jgi:hypothetical protein
VTVNVGVNYLAVIVAAIVAVVIGIVYYGILGVVTGRSRSGRRSRCGSDRDPLALVTCFTRRSSRQPRRSRVVGGGSLTPSART